MAWLLPPLPPNFAAALRDVHARRPESRMAAAERLASPDPEERSAAQRGLRSLAEDAHPSVRATALAGLGAVGTAEDLPRLIRAFADASPEVREIATLAAARVGGAEAISALRAALASEFPEVRFQAAASVAELAPQEAAELLVPMLGDADPEVRGQVVAALGSLAEPHLAGQLARALDDASAEVQLEAALALAAQGDGRGSEVLLETLRARHRIDEVAQALAAIGHRPACEALYRTGSSLLSGPHGRAAAGAALVRLGDARGNPVLRRVLRSFSALARSYAVQLVREADAVLLIDELVRLTHRPRGVDMLTLVDSLAHFAGRSAPARDALAELAARADEIGESARNALQALPRSNQP